MLSVLKRVPFGAQILLGLVAGVALGLLARQYEVGWLTEALTRIGGMFVQLLKLAVPPLVFTAILVSITRLREVTGAPKQGEPVAFVRVFGIEALKLRVAFGDAGLRLFECRLV